MGILGTYSIRTCRLAKYILVSPLMSLDRGSERNCRNCAARYTATRKKSISYKSGLLPTESRKPHLTPFMNVRKCFRFPTRSGLSNMLCTTKHAIFGVNLWSNIDSDTLRVFSWSSYSLGLTRQLLTTSSSLFVGSVGFRLFLLPWVAPFFLVNIEPPQAAVNETGLYIGAVIWVIRVMSFFYHREQRPCRRQEIVFFFVLLSSTCVLRF